MSKRRCPVCGETLKSKSAYIEHMRQEFEEHQTLADMAADAVEDAGAKL